MIKHEFQCGNNPINIRPCFGCTHLENGNDGSNEVYFIAGGEIDSRVEKTRDYFYCNKKQIKIYAPKAKFKGLLEKYPEHFEDQEPMPITCESKQISFLED